MNLRNFAVLGVAFAAIGGVFSYGVSGCAPKPIVDEDGGGKTCMETGAGPGEGCPCPSGYKPKACYEGPTGTLGPGRACKSGTRKCVDGILTACEGQILPDPQGEVCNMVDDDCDGIIDNIKTEDPIITPLDEAGLDPPLEGGAQCYVNGATGLCAAGRYGCNKMGQKDCVAIITTDPDGGASPYTEICNTLDDDCNGTADDVDFQGQMCQVTFDDGGSPKGECAKGMRSCVNGLDSCVGPKPMSDSCNGKDDNCNGQYDESSCPCGCAQGQWCCVSGSTPIGGCYTSNPNVMSWNCYQKP
jgi:hypothetical protein